MTPTANRLRAALAITPGAPFLAYEPPITCLERWRQEARLPEDADVPAFLGLEPCGHHPLGGLYPFEALPAPPFEARRLEDRGDYTLEQDGAGRIVMRDKEPRDALPEFVEFPVRSRRTWDDEVRWRLAPEAGGRLEALEPARGADGAARAAGLVMRLDLVGGYSFLRNLVGSNQLLYFVYDEPDLVHEMMESWLALVEAVAERHQRLVPLDELVFHEDICFRHGPLISPAMIREFLLPIYRRYLEGVSSRQEAPPRVRLDSDGDVRPVLPLYREAGFDAVGPLDVSSGCDVLEVAERFPDMVLWGGIDRRLLVGAPEALDAALDRLLPPMMARGGYVPHVDHPLLASTPLETYLHLRQRIGSYGA